MDAIQEAYCAWAACRALPCRQSRDEQRRSDGPVDRAYYQLRIDTGYQVVDPAELAARGIEPDENQAIWVGRGHDSAASRVTLSLDDIQQLARDLLAYCNVFEGRDVRPYTMF